VYTHNAEHEWRRCLLFAVVFFSFHSFFRVPIRSRRRKKKMRTRRLFVRTNIRIITSSKRLLYTSFFFLSFSLSVYLFFFRVCMNGMYCSIMCAWIRWDSRYISSNARLSRLERKFACITKYEAKLIPLIVFRVAFLRDSDDSVQCSWRCTSWHADWCFNLLFSVIC
jgi:hypothetical protein